jgi:hypothetical protein
LQQQQQQQHHRSTAAVPPLKLPPKHAKQQQQQHPNPPLKAVLPPIPLPAFLLDASAAQPSGTRLTLEELMQRHQETKKTAVDPALEKRSCCLCRAVYREADNHDAACTWHPGKRCGCVCVCVSLRLNALTFVARQVLERRTVVMLRQPGGQRQRGLQVIITLFRLCFFNRGLQGEQAQRPLRQRHRAAGQELV